MITVMKSTSSFHILDPTTGRAVCGFPNEPRETLQVESLKDLAKDENLRLCQKCRLRATLPHLKAMHHLTVSGGNTHTLLVQVRLGKCQEMSPCLHVMPDLSTPFGTPLCNQGHVKLAVGAVPTGLSFPARGDVSQVRVEEGPVCSKCLKVLQNSYIKAHAGGKEQSGPSSDGQRGSSGGGSPPPSIPIHRSRASENEPAAGVPVSRQTPPPAARADPKGEGSSQPAPDLSMAPQHLKHKKALMVLLKDQLLRGEIRYPAYIRKALPLQKEIDGLVEILEEEAK